MRPAWKSEDHRALPLCGSCHATLTRKAERLHVCSGQSLASTVTVSTSADLPDVVAWNEEAAEWEAIVRRSRFALVQS